MRAAPERLASGQCAQNAMLMSGQMYYKLINSSPRLVRRGRNYAIYLSATNTIFTATADVAAAAAAAALDPMPPNRCDRHTQ